MIDLITLAIIMGPVGALAALLYGVYMGRTVLAQPEGTPKMISISQAIREGANAYLKRQFKTIAVVVVAIAILMYIAFQGTPGGLALPFAFVIGAIFSSAAGYTGMYVAVRANVRCANAARTDLNSALGTAFRAGTVNGMILAGLGLLGVSSIFILSYYFYIGEGVEKAIPVISNVVVGFSFGASLLALFMRVGGGIFTKGADVGADLVGKVEKGIPEDDPRNPAVIADNVGDNVGDCAGMGADIYESYVASLVAAIILGAVALRPDGVTPYGLVGMALPILFYAAAAFSAIGGTLFVKAGKGVSAMKAMDRGLLMANLIMAVLFALISYFLFGGDKLLLFNGDRAFLAAFAGLAATQLIGWMTEYYTAPHKNIFGNITGKVPVQEIAKSAQTGAGTTIISGVAYGYQSSFMMAIIVAAAIYVGYWAFGFYGIALVGVGMLGTTGITVSMDTFGPISDNAQGIVEMSGLDKIDKKAAKITSELDAVGNTTKALTKGFAIASAAVSAVALFAAFIAKVHVASIDVAKPVVFIGFLMGAALPFLFSSMVIQAVAKNAFLIVEEVRRQFKTKKIMEGKDKPDYARCVDISTQGALHELVVPVVITVLSPIVIGYFLGPEPLGGFLGGAIVSSLMLAVFMCNAGGAWDNAKKYIEDGNFGGKGTPTHAAAVIGDTVGDPFKDTAGPSLNIMMKILSVISLLIAGLLVGSGMSF
ncbi:MAG: sodium-translocating pyrophosphatase [Candidatus Micrarchaeota archaeon]